MAFALVTAAVTAGAAAYSANQQAKAGAAQESAQRAAALKRMEIAEINFSANQDNLDAQLTADKTSIYLAGIENTLRQRQVAVNSALAEREAKIHDDNATRLRLRSKTVESQGREQVIRIREDQEEVTGAQIAAIGANGLELSGSPMEAVAKSAGDMQIFVEEAWYQTTQEARELREQADTLEYTADLTRAQAGFDREIAETAIGIQSGTNQISLLTAQNRYRQGQQAAEIARLEQYSEGVGQGYQADATRARTKAAVSSTYANAASQIGTTYLGYAGQGSQPATQPAYTAKN